MKYGHFDDQKREYVIERVDLPVSWTNYLGVRDMCVVVNHVAGGYMFYRSPEYHRMTRFRGNAVPMDDAVERGYCSGSHELGNNHCGSLQKDLVLQPGEEVRLVFMLGEGDRAQGKKIREKYSDLNAVDAVYRKLHEYWEDKFSRLQIQTPNEGMNAMINTWNLYQAEVNIMFSRFASFIEVGGRTGLGYRDTAQDAMTIPHSNPEKCRQRIVELLRGLTSRGYGLHLFQPEWFEPDNKKEKKKPFKSPTVIPSVNQADIVHGVEDACSDDALWLIPSIVEYIRETGTSGSTPPCVKRCTRCAMRSFGIRNGSSVA